LSVIQWLSQQQRLYSLVAADDATLLRDGGDEQMFGAK
jgi:hypothetical protein